MVETVSGKESESLMEENLNELYFVVTEDVDFVVDVFPPKQRKSLIEGFLICGCWLDSETSHGILVGRRGDTNRGDGQRNGQKILK